MKKRTRVVLSLTVVLILVVAVCSYIAYSAVLGPSVKPTKKGENQIELYINTGSTYTDVFNNLTEKKTIKYPRIFNLLAEKKGYSQGVKPGHYTIPVNLSNNELLNRLLSGNQTPVKVTFNSLRTMEYLSEVLAWQLEPDSIAFISLLNSPENLQAQGIIPDSLYMLLLPDTYEFYWTATPEEFIQRMQRESVKYWSTRKTFAEEKGLTPAEVIIMASIVEKETNKNDEKPTVAGVYLNRLKKKIKLQADPTVVYAVGDFELRRVLKKHTRIDHPYNTYNNYGLPPGPICIPSKASIESVLHAEKHNYIYFCAREDMSGYHNFAVTYAQHLRNARKFQQELNKKNIN